MAIWDKFTREFIDIIQWTEPSQNEILAYRFPRSDNEIKNGAKLIVREGQAAAFIKEGQLADVKSPGMFTLDTNNMPILSKIIGWKYGFESPFKCEVYFVATRQWVDQKWGTSNPIMVRDPEFGPVRIRAFGTYAFKIIDPGTFIKEIVATDPECEAYEVKNQFRNVIVSKLSDAIGGAKMPILDMAGNYEKLGKIALEKIAPELAKMGIGLTQFYVENISMPPEVEAAMDKRSSMGVLGNLDQYTKYQAAEAIRDAANNPSGGAGLGASLGAGVALGGAIVNQFNPAMQASAQLASGPPPLPASVQFHVAMGGKQAGPFGLDKLQDAVASGELTRTSLVWKPGMANWQPAETVPELAGLLSSLPPPLPK